MLNTKQQTQLLSLWLSDQEMFVKTIPLVKPSYFNPELRKIVKFVIDYHQKYNGIPTVDVINSNVDGTVTLKGTKPLTPDQRLFIVEQMEMFCRQSALKNIIVEQSPELIINEDYGQLEKLIRDAISIKVDSNIGIQFFNNIEERHASPESAIIRYSTGYPALDGVMDGGVARKEMLLALAISGGGKSVSILNLGLNLIRQRDVQTNRYLNCLYISLELSERMIDKRSQMVVAGMSSHDIDKNLAAVASAVEAAGQQCGEMVIRKLRLGCTVNDIRALVKEIQIQLGWIPDVIILDYLDKLHPAQKVSSDNIGLRDKFITEEFYDILEEFNAIGLTASQLTKDASNVEVYTQAHQAGGAEKTRSADWVLALILTDSMRAAGQIGIQMLKTRSSGGVGTVVTLGWDAKSLRILPTQRPSALGNRLNSQSHSTPQINEVLRETPVNRVAELMDLL